MDKMVRTECDGHVEVRGRHSWGLPLHMWGLPLHKTLPQPMDGSPVTSSPASPLLQPHARYSPNAPYSPHIHPISRRRSEPHHCQPLSPRIAVPYLVFAPCHCSCHSIFTPYSPCIRPMSLLMPLHVTYPLHSSSRPLLCTTTHINTSTTHEFGTLVPSSPMSLCRLHPQATPPVAPPLAPIPLLGVATRDHSIS